MFKQHFKIRYPKHAVLASFSESNLHACCFLYNLGYSHLSKLERAQASILRSTGLSVKEITKKLKKSERWVVKWSSRNDGFEDKKRTGRPKILNKAAKRILNKAKYKRGNSTRQLSQRLASKGHVGGKTPSGGL